MSSPAKYNAKGAAGADNNNNNKGADAAKGADNNNNNKGAPDAAKGAPDAKGDNNNNAKGAEETTKICVIGVPCHGEKTGKALTAIGRKFDETIDNARKSVSDGVKQFVKGQQDCAMDVVKNVPKVAHAAKDTIANVNLNIAEPFKKAYLMAKNKLYSIVNRIALGPDWESILNDPTLNNELLSQKVSRNSRLIKLITEDTEFKNHFKKWSDEYADALVNSLNTAQPAIDKMTDKAKDLMMDASGKLGTTLGDSLTNTIKTAIAAIPFVGAAIDGVITLGKLGNQILETCEPVITKGAGVILPIVDAVDYQYEQTKCKGTELIVPVKNAMARIEAATKSGGGGGGKHYTRKHINYKIQKATRRVQHLLKKFKPAAVAANTTFKKKYPNHPTLTKRRR